MPITDNTVVQVVYKINNYKIVVVLDSDMYTGNKIFFSKKEADILHTCKWIRVRYIYINILLPNGIDARDCDSE